jgi:5'-deoxynucleotidase YfbR-like HD superfamily hydrolase
MEKPTVDEVRQLFSELVIPFYGIKRDMYVPLGRHRAENDAEQSWSLGLIACALAERLDPGLDVGKIAELAIVHDLIEIPAGDTSIWDTEAAGSKEQREEEALLELATRFSDFPWIVQLIREYEEKSSPEAIYLWSIDKYVASFMRLVDHEAGNLFYKDQAGLTLDAYKKGIEPTRQKAHAHPGVGEIYEEVYNIFISNPEWFVPIREPGGL